mmetsp:Transcript_118037/g.252128  ORF Transcript_118037/g.252128 Transcript_118037/m.252128 type:complete len:530 (+) Transcript_118037:77-1666(+)
MAHVGLLRDVMLLVFSGSLNMAAGHAASHWIFPTPFNLPCDYAVNQEPAVSVTGSVPEYLNGSMYHAMFISSAKLGVVSGGIVAVHFSPGHAVTASFGNVEGSNWHRTCHPDLPLPTNFSSDGVVTISADPRSQMSHRVLGVTSMSELPAVDGKSLRTVEAPVTWEGDSLGPPQNKFPGPGPAFFQPSHMPTDANGDLYGFVYIFDPSPAYRIYKIAKATGKRTVFPDVPASRQYHEHGMPGPAYIHQCMLLTPSFMIIPEIPVGMSAPPTFDFKSIQDKWIADGHMIFRVLDKQTGRELGSYEAPPCYSWHGINAYENSTHIMVEMTWSPNATSPDVFTGRRHGPFWWYQQGKLMRFTMPRADRPQAGAERGIATPTPLTFPPYVSPEFAVVHPGAMWQRRARYTWALATDSSHKIDPWFPHVIKVDLDHPEAPPLFYSSNTRLEMLGAPVFAPRSVDSADDDGVLLLLSTRLWDPLHMGLLILDAATMKKQAYVTLPVKPSPVGLHNHWSPYPNEALDSKLQARVLV